MTYSLTLRPRALDELAAARDFLASIRPATRSSSRGAVVGVDLARDQVGLQVT
jgi:hypothetical protein